MKSKFVKVSLVIIVLGILLCACQQKNNLPTISKEELEAIVTATLPPSNLEEVASQPKKAVLTPNYIRKQVRSKDNSLVLLNADFSYPQIENLSGLKTIDSINQEIEGKAQDDFNHSFEEGQKEALEFYDYHSEQGRPTSLLPFVTEQTYQVMYNDSYIISNLITDFSYFGGAHPNTLYSSYTYHLLTGDKLTASYFLSEKMTKEEEKQFVANLFLEAYKKNPDNFFPDTEQILNEGKFEYGFYVTEDSVVFYTNPYEIAPYVAGKQEVSVNRKK